MFSKDLFQKKLIAALVTNPFGLLVELRMLFKTALRLERLATLPVTALVGPDVSVGHVVSIQHELFSKRHPASVAYVQFQRGIVFFALMPLNLVLQSVFRSVKRGAANFARQANVPPSKLGEWGITRGGLALSSGGMFGFDVEAVTFLIGEPGGRTTQLAFNPFNVGVVEPVLVQVGLVKRNRRARVAFQRCFAEMHDVEMINDVGDIGFFAQRAGQNILLAVFVEHVRVGLELFSAEATAKRL